VDGVGEGNMLVFLEVVEDFLCGLVLVSDLEGNHDERDVGFEF